MSRDAMRDDDQGRDEEQGRDEGIDAIETVEPSRLGKEAKIGVMVIGLLLVTFVGVMAWRLMGSSADEQANVADAPPPPKPADGKPKRDPIDDILKDSGPKRRPSVPPTVVPANHAPPRVGGLAAAKTEDKRPNVSPMPSRTPPSAADPFTKPSPRGEDSRNLEPPDVRSPDAEEPKTHRGPGGAGHSPFPAREDPDDRYADRTAGLPETDRDSGRRRHADDEAVPPAPDPEKPLHAVHAMPDREDPNGFVSVEGSTSSAGPRSHFRRDERPDEPVALSPLRRSEPERRRPSALSRGPAPRRDDGKYEVQPNDSYWTISERLYGTGAYFNALAKHNQSTASNELRLQPGELISAPTVAELEKSYPDLCPKADRRESMASQERAVAVSARQSPRGGKSYTVVEGDTLFNIARYELGKASRWAEIYELNRDVLGKDFNYLKPGLQLQMPSGDKEDVIARPPSSTYRR